MTPRLTSPQRAIRLLALLNREWMCVADVARALGVSMVSARRYLADIEAAQPGLLVSEVCEHEHKQRRWYRANLEVMA